MEINAPRPTTQQINFSASVIFDNIRSYNCPRCGTIMYYYDEDRLVFTSTHRNTFINKGSAYYVPRCQRCEAEVAHMFKAVEIMRRTGD